LITSVKKLTNVAFVIADPFYKKNWAGVPPIKLLWNDPKLCPVIPTSNQDGRQAKNRKRGDEIIPLEMHFFVDSLLLVTQIIKGKQLYYKM
jgi:hypothetical protein